MMDRRVTLSLVPPPRSRDRDRTVLYLSILSAIVFAPVGLHLPYFPVWLQARGFSEAEIAAVIAAPMVLRVIMTPLIATIADKRGIALTLAACAVTMCAAYAGLGFADGFATIFIGAAVAAVSLGMLPSLTDALTLSEVRRVESAGRGPITFSHIRVWTPAGVLVTMLCSGQIVSLMPGTRIIYALAGLAALPAIVAVVTAGHLRRRAAGGRGADGRRALCGAELRLVLATIGAAALVQGSHAQIYSFATLHWAHIGLSADFIGLAWATGVAAEALFFAVTTRIRGAEKYAIGFLVAGGLGAALRWLAMSADPTPWQILVLQAMHGLSFAATYLGSVLLVGRIAGPAHRARMQGFLAAASALGLAAATYVCGKLTGLFGETTYLAMAGLACAGLALALVAGRLKRHVATFP